MKNVHEQDPERLLASLGYVHIGFLWPKVIYVFISAIKFGILPQVSMRKGSLEPGSMAVFDILILFVCPGDCCFIETCAAIHGRPCLLHQCQTTVCMHYNRMAQW